MNWELDEEQQQFLDFVRRVTKLRNSQPVLQRRKFFAGRGMRGDGVKDISWFGPSGHEMSDTDWTTGYVRCLGMRLAGDLIDEEDERGNTVRGDTLLVLLNAHYRQLPFVLPVARAEHHWEMLLDTSDDAIERLRLEGGQTYHLQGRSLAVLRTMDVREAGQSEPTTVQFEWSPVAVRLQSLPVACR